MKYAAQKIGSKHLVIALFLMESASCSAPPLDTTLSARVVINGNKLSIPDTSPLRSRLVVQPVANKDTTHALLMPAVVEANPGHVVAILPPFTGRVIELKVSLGDRVSRGQTLLTIASGDAAQAYADSDKSRDALELARKQLDRAHAVKDAGGEATKDIEAAQSAFVQAQAESNRADIRLKSLGGSAELRGSARQMSVTAPMNGTITTLAVATGAYINDASAATMTVANLDSVWVTANVPEQSIGAISKDQKVDVVLAAYPTETLHGTVQFVDAVLAPDTRRGKVRIAFANADGKLKLNMYATATLLLPQAAQVFVPQSALLMNNDSTTVFVEVAPWTFERRAVVLGYDEGDQARVVDGLKSGERVIVKGGVLIND